MRNGSLTLGGVPQKVLVEASQLSTPSLGSSLDFPARKQAAFIRRFRCNEFELRASVSIALNRLDAEYRKLRALGAISSVLAALERRQPRAPAAL